MAIRRTKTRRSVNARKSPSRRAVRQWSSEEVAFMRKYYRKYETSWVARQLGRSVYSVRYKAVDLSIRKANPSVWKGNTGPVNAFKTRKVGRTVNKPARKAAARRNPSRTRTYRASSKRRTARQAKPRRANRRRSR